MFTDVLRVYSWDLAEIHRRNQSIMLFGCILSEYNLRGNENVGYSWSDYAPEKNSMVSVTAI